MLNGTNQFQPLNMPNTNIFMAHRCCNYLDLGGGAQAGGGGSEGAGEAMTMTSLASCKSKKWKVRFE
jgi:hypothetical protein